MKEKGSIFLILCLMLLLASCMINTEKNASSGNEVQNAYEYETTTTEDTEGNSNTHNSLPNNFVSSKFDETMETLKSDDNKTIITVYTYTKRRDDIKHIDKIVVTNGKNSFEINDIIGYYGNIRWALDQSKAVVEFYGREWRDFIIIDTKKKEDLFERPFSLQQLMDSFKKQGIAFNFKVNKNRPDIEYRLNKMIDEDNIRVDYIVHDENYVTQSGSFNYNLSKGTFSELIQNEPKAEG